MIQHLHTNRLALKQISKADAESLFEIWSDPEVTQFMNIDNFTTVNQAEEMIVFLNQLTEECKAIRYSIIDRESNKIIGSCGFNTLDFENKKAEIGYDIAKKYWGKGYAPEAITALVDHAFQTLKLHRIEAKIEPANTNSIKVVEKLMFTYEGTLRQSEKSKGRFIDLHMYARLNR
ncbi:GNAT family protein [Gracilibacillus sp. S3-1-1]|uniref:GNAT family protein n=1 Tax=Gracilibacillus pellucidus TaxID=3095368 RepID=A0ACC6M104_9BACI|nr:GNAT family protein [Gracilibacillus sp. S3-1-1]MDX8044412.1 GNAT family protein [Gracilibacillus sp. S3-1-1]